MHISCSLGDHPVQVEKMLPTEDTPAISLSYLYHRSIPIGPAQSHLLRPQNVPEYRKGFYEVSLHYWRDQSLTPSTLQTLSKKQTKNVAISCWCVFFNIIGAGVLQVAMLLAFYIYVCYIWPVPTEPKFLTEYWNYPIKRKKICPEISITSLLSLPHT